MNDSFFADIKINQLKNSLLLSFILTNNNQFFYSNIFSSLKIKRYIYFLLSQYQAFIIKKSNFYQTNIKNLQLKKVIFIKIFIFVVFFSIQLDLFQGESSLIIFQIIICRKHKLIKELVTLQYLEYLFSFNFNQILLIFHQYQCCQVSRHLLKYLYQFFSQVAEHHIYFEQVYQIILLYSQ
ncbi:transmembrane protein, putative (macronuclear) [Tetrahymena thermophila SB210]|uniref:Transmembrane protein, putative n=1 Tax=Tetrahymena thermophila (strain SB210) TaxID=312017 RepID=W7XLL8_TETTS|nr:transmembrane protein, putative [Tetrahymena thermophila SB210]EWS76514.1 transmembrane protein, putative [Tetrahymena thermophila SB210]|eukprot:XP_012650951.1 transmembrane protein, putative [Tetrahymena thermophila SB210]